MQLKLTFLALVMLSSQALAGTDISVVENSQTTQSQTQSLQQKAGEWGLSPEDYQRYQQLMNGPRGIQSPGLDPLSALGIEARTPAERRQYAEKWVKEEFARTQKELDFQREINTAWQRLYPDRLPVNLGNAAGVARDTGGRLALFVKSKNCPTCDARLEDRPLQLPGIGALFLIGDDEQSRYWLAENAQALIARHAAGMIVSVDSASAVESLRDLAPGVPMAPAPGSELARRLQLRHYPVLITDTGLSRQVRP